MDENEVRNFGCCEECGETVTDESTEYYVNEDGEVFCSIECVLQHYRIVKIET